MPRASSHIRLTSRSIATTHTLTGVERVSWHNASSDAVSDLWFHLYLNAFRNTNSTFVKESGGQLRGVEIVPGGWGWIDLKKLAIANGGADLLRGATMMAPDDGNADDRTVLRTVLPQPVPPGGDVTLDIAFTARLPRVFARTGYVNDYYLVGQWFPKLAVYEAAGTRGRTAGGWNCHQFHANSEFYADYGSFDVRITTPERFVVGATGQLKSSTRNSGGTVTRRYVQDDVHDFAWTADPRFVEVNDQFIAAREVSQAEYASAAALVGRPLDEMRLSDVSIHLLMQPSHMPQAARLLKSIRASIKNFGLWYGRYPYPTLTIVDPAYGGLGSGGMEYPTFITGGTSLLLNHWPFDQIHVNDEVLVHEYGHQFWYGLVGSNEFEEAWLDEGFNQYSTGRLMGRLFGEHRSMGAVFGIELGHVDEGRMTNGPTADLRPHSAARVDLLAWRVFLLQLRQTRARARDARAPARRADDGEDHADVFGAVAVQASVERRLLRRRQRGGRPRPPMVLRPRRRGHRRRGLRDLPGVFVPPRETRRSPWRRHGRDGLLELAR